MDWTAENIIAALAKRSAGSRWGIGNAANYLKSIEPCFAGGTNGSGGLCPTEVFGKASADQWQAVLKEATSRLTYCDDEMEVKDHSEPSGSGSGSSLKNALLEFSHVLTSTKRDRDGDVLESKGAKIDKKMPLLWQHIPIQPIGKYVKTIEQDEKRIIGKSVILDTSLGRDAAVLVEDGALRISHGFKALDVEPLYHKDNRELITGFHVKEFEVMEVSLVSVPSNTDAIILAYSREKLHNPLVKSWAQQYHDNRKIIVPGHDPRKDACGCSQTKVAGTPPATSTAGAVTTTKGVKAVQDTKAAYNCPKCDVGWDLTGVPDGMDMSTMQCPLCGTAIGGDANANGKAAGGDLAGDDAMSTKAGRVLSAKNAGRIKQAKAMLEAVITDAKLNGDASEDGDGELIEESSGSSSSAAMSAGNINAKSETVAEAVAEKPTSHVKAIIANALRMTDLNAAIAMLESAKSEITEALGLAIDQRDAAEFASLGL